MEKIKQAALRYLARRDHSKAELSQKLQRKGFAQEEIQCFLQYAAQKGWIKEERYIENYIRARSAKGFGPLRIRLELQSKGITHEKIAEQLNIADNAWLSIAARVFEKTRQGQLSKEALVRAKQIRFLKQRGFTQEQIDFVFANAF